MIQEWYEVLPPGAGSENLFALFKQKAEELTVRVIRAASPAEAELLLVEEMKHLHIRHGVSAPLTLLDSDNLAKLAEAAGIELSFEMEPSLIEQAGMGISEFELAIAESGTIVQDASSLHARLVSMLPPVHAAVVQAGSLVETFADALEVIEKVYEGQMPPYVSFITGPSRTADIERVLTIGVHGPQTLIVLFIENS